MRIKNAVLGTAILLLGLFSQAWAAQPPGQHLNVTEVFVDDPNNPTSIMIIGTDLDFGPGPLVVTLGIYGPLNITGTPTDTLIDADLPALIPDGDYLLTVSNGNGQSQGDEYDLTIGAVGPQGDQGEQGKIGPAGADGADGAQGVQGKFGPPGVPGQQGVQGKIGPQGDPGTQGAQGKIGPPGDQGPAGSFAAPAVSRAIFGTGTINHYTGTGWVLESTGADNLTFRITSPSFWTLSMVHPTGCAGSPPTLATADITVSHRWATAIGDTLAASFCGEASPIYATIWNSASGGEVGYFRCWRWAGNANTCQRILP